MPEDQPDLFDRLLELLTAIIMPVWGDLIGFIPLVFFVLIALFLLFVWWMRRRAGAVNRSRLIPRAAGVPPPGVHLPGPSWWPFLAPISLALLLFGVIFNPALIAVGLLIGLLPLAGWLRDANREWRSQDLAAEPGGVHDAALAAGATIAALPSGTWRVTAPPPQLAAPIPHVVVSPPPGVHLPGPSPWPFFAPIALAVLFFGVIFSPWLILGGILLGLIAAGGWLIDANREWRSTDSLGHAVPATLDPARVWPRRLVPVFAAVIAVTVFLAVLPSLVDWLAALKPSPASPTPIVVPARPEIAASNAQSFETRTLLVPASRAFELVFHNREAGVPHNVKITEGSAQATTYFDGEVVDGITDVTYQVPALEPGDYYFLCKVHPNMNGTVQARPEAGPGGGPQGSSSPGGGSSPSP